MAYLTLSPTVQRELNDKLLQEQDKWLAKLLLCARQCDSRLCTQWK